MIQSALKYLLFALVLASLSLPLLQRNFRFIPAWPLDGSFQSASEPEFDWNDWFDGNFQSAEETWLNEQIGAREYLVRLRNQYYFDVFDMAMANGVSPGKDGVLLDVGYVDAFYGKDFAGEDVLTDKLLRWKHVQRGLDSVGVKAFLALAPGKGSFFEDKFSDFLKDEHRPITNYEFIADFALGNDIRLLDLKKLYHSWNDTSRFPLFPKGGIHWSEYGVAHVCDTLRGYIQSLTGRPLQKFWYDIEISDTARGGDNDIAVGMNLLFTPNHEKLAYPIRYFGEDSTITPTKFIVIADSYYYGIMRSGFGDRVCSYGGFWFYFKDAQPSHVFPTSNVEELDILEELKKQDVLMLMMTEPQMQRFGWGSVEKLEELLYPKTESETTL
ncbi:MAG: hypothetical protein K9J17_11135 [Flavobacteriales bacterium]|nr:hypothetical protein [Flavobacteriales bacterium]